MGDYMTKAFKQVSQALTESQIKELKAHLLDYIHFMEYSGVAKDDLVLNMAKRLAKKIC